MKDIKQEYTVQEFDVIKEEEKLMKYTKQWQEFERKCQEMRDDLWYVDPEDIKELVNQVIAERDKEIVNLVKNNEYFKQCQECTCDALDVFINLINSK